MLIWSIYIILVMLITSYLITVIFWRVRCKAPNIFFFFWASGDFSLWIYMRDSRLLSTFLSHYVTIILSWISDDSLMLRSNEHFLLDQECLILRIWKLDVSSVQKGKKKKQMFLCLPSETLVTFLKYILLYKEVNLIILI